MTYAQERGLLELDTSEVDKWIGVPLGGQQPKEPFSVNDVRRFVQGVANPNPLYFDEVYAAESRFGRRQVRELVARGFRHFALT